MRHLAVRLLERPTAPEDHAMTLAGPANPFSAFHGAAGDRTSAARPARRCRLRDW